MSSEYLSDDEIAKLAAKMRVADPTQDNGSFDSVTREDALIWLRLLGVQGLSPRSPDSKEEVHEKLRSALWDTQRSVHISFLLSWLLFDAFLDWIISYLERLLRKQRR